jgi:aminoglycoside/choline kinase family phosphotransferase|tara:strand:+ start:2683 stop:3609 length:927 start_codon:yes stop_codon:yes gene_type:complete
LNKNLKEITDWLSSVIGTQSFNLEPLREEASNRKYFRIKTDKKSFVLVDNSENTEQAANFLYSSKLLINSSINVPEIYAFSEDLRFMLMQDLGEHTLDAATQVNDKEILVKALEQLSLIYFCDQDILKSCTKDSLLKQTEAFTEFCSEQGCNANEIQELELLRKELVENLLNQQFMPVHNDFERRNLMLFEDQLFVIDFQDLNVGPIGIDLASLLFEHDRDYPEELLEEVLNLHIINTGLQIEVDEIMNHIMSALSHRSMRIVGTFNRYFKDGKLLNRKRDIEKFLSRIYLGLNYLKKPQIKIIEKIL